ncbi:hypothetical protein KAH81_09025, partial [bacterium]|nr:hypothetical protein [bacterium]
MKIKYLIACVLFVIALFAIPETMNYQGKLTSLDGVAFEGVLTVTFSIYDVETSGFPLWTENQDVTFVKGLFDVQLGSMVPLSDFLDFSDEYFIEIAIGGDVLNPRQPLTTVPYAFRAAIADSVVGGGGGGNNLDEAYDASPSGSKRIDADDGAVEIVSGLFNSPLSVTSNSIADAAIYATNAPGGNAIWADENIFANNANIIAKGDVRVEDASGYTAGLVGGSGNLWLHGRIEMNNDRTIFARNSTGDLKGILTPLNGADDVILSMADGNNFYIQDNTYSNVAQFAGGDVALYLFGDLSVSDALYIGDVPQDMTADSVLTIDGGQVKKVAASSLSGADSDWQIGSGIIYNMTDNVGIGTSTPSSKLTAVNDFGSSDGIVVKVDASGGSGMEYPVIYGINSDVNMTSNGSGIGVYGRGHGGTAAIVGIGLWGSAYSTSVSSNLKGVIGQIETGSVPAPAAAIYGVVGDVGVAYNGPWSGFFTGAPVRIPNMSVPSATDDGAIYYDTDDNKMYYYDGSTWVEMGSDNDWAYSSGSGLTGDIYHTGNIGIGTTSPSYKLDVAGYLRVNSTSYPGRDYRIQCGSRQQIYASNDLVEYVDGNKDVIVGVTGPNNDFYICSGTEGSKFFTAEGTNQRIGIGTISPSQKLDVNGNVKVGDALYVGSVPDDAVADSVLTIDGGQVKKIATSSISGADADWQIGSGIIYNTTDDVGIGTSSPEYELDIRESMGIATTDEANFLTISALPSNGPTLRFNSDDDLIFASGLIYSGVSSSTERMRLTGDGNLGIGSDAPLSILSVNGDGYSSAALYSGDDGYTYAARFDGTVIAEDGGLFQAHLLSGNYAVYARIGSATATDKRAVYGLADGGNGTKYGGYFATTNTGNNYGVFGRASSGTISYGGAFEARIASNQNIGIFASDQNPPVYPFGSGISYAGWFDGDVMTTDRTYFGDSDVYIRQDGSNNMVLRDPNTNGGSEVTLSDLYSGGAFIQNQSSSWQDGWFQIQKEITTTQDAIAEIDFSADITGGYGSAYGVNVTSDTLQDKGVMIGVLAS